MFTGIVEETGSNPVTPTFWIIREDCDSGKKSTRWNQDRRQYCGKWCLPDGGFPGKRWIYRRCDGGDGAKNQPW